MNRADVHSTSVFPVWLTDDVKNASAYCEFVVNVPDRDAAVVRLLSAVPYVQNAVETADDGQEYCLTTNAPVDSPLLPCAVTDNDAEVTNAETPIDDVANCKYA